MKKFFLFVFIFFVGQAAFAKNTDHCFHYVRSNYQSYLRSSGMNLTNFSRVSPSDSSLAQTFPRLSNLQINPNLLYYIGSNEIIGPSWVGIDLLAVDPRTCYLVQKYEIYSE